MSRSPPACGLQRPNPYGCMTPLLDPGITCCKRRCESNDTHRVVMIAARGMGTQIVSCFPGITLPKASAWAWLTWYNA
eukprot:scaffold88433_cov61-Cyclotella_meneghiniana.AAC.2